MSSDNGCFVGVFPKANGSKEYRVIEAGAIENCDYEFGATEKDENGFLVLSDREKELQDCERLMYYGQARSFDNEVDALKAAHKLHEEVLRDFGVCEYGVCTIEYDRPLPNLSHEEAKAKLDSWQKDQEKKSRQEQKERDRNTKRYFVLMPVEVVEYQGSATSYGISSDKIKEYQGKFGSFDNEEHAVKCAPFATRPQLTT